MGSTASSTLSTSEKLTISLSSASSEESSITPFTREELVEHLNRCEKDLKSTKESDKSSIMIMMKGFRSMIKEIDRANEEKARMRDEEEKARKASPEYFERSLIENGSIAEEFLTKKLAKCEKNLEFATENDKHVVLNLINKFKTYVELAKKVKRQSTSAIGNSLMNKLRINEIVQSNEAPSTVLKSEEELKWDWETLNKFNEIFGELSKDEDAQIKVINELLNACKYIDDINWITPEGDYPRDEMNMVMASSSEQFLRNHPNLDSSADIINRNHRNCLEQIKVFDNYFNSKLDVETYGICDSIINDLKNLAVEVVKAENNHRSIIKEFYEYVLENIELVKIGADYIIDLTGVEASCIARISLLRKKETTYRRSDNYQEDGGYSYHKSTDQVSSIAIRDDCANRIADNKPHVIKAIQHVESLKNDLRRMQKAAKGYGALVKEVSKYAKEYEMKFDEMKHKIFSVKLLPNKPPVEPVRAKKRHISQIDAFQAPLMHTLQIPKNLRASTIRELKLNLNKYSYDEYKSCIVYTTEDEDGNKVPYIIDYKYKNYICSCYVALDNNLLYHDKNNRKLAPLNINNSVVKWKHA
jgi:hypothetical protein